MDRGCRGCYPHLAKQVLCDPLGLPCPHKRHIVALIRQRFARTQEILLLAYPVWIPCRSDTVRIVLFA